MRARQRSTTTRSRLAVAGVTLALTVGGLGGIATTQAQATAPRAAKAATYTTSDNPLLGTWGVYNARTQDNQVYNAWATATGANKQMLARLALRPRVTWFGAWQSNDRIQKLVGNYIANIKAQNPSAISMMAMFGIKNWEAARSQRHWSAAYIKEYKQWVDNAARGIGTSRVMLVLQPDLIYAVENDHPAVPLSMIRYAAQKFGSLKNTTVYLDAGARDYVPSHGVSMVKTLKSAGIQYARGFSLNDTHHDSTNAEIGYGNTLAAGLAKAGLPHHFVISTSSNGHPSTVATLKTNVDAPACASKSQTRCLGLGLPPTTATSAPYWGITAKNKTIAKRLVDGFVWVDRPWLTEQSKGSKFTTSRAVTLGRNTPFVAFTTKSPTATLGLGDVRKGAAAGATRKNISIHNGSSKYNMTIDSIRFTSSNGGGRWAKAASSTCRTGSFVAPGKSCTLTVAFTPVKTGYAKVFLQVATNTNNPVTRHLQAHVVG